MLKPGMWMLKKIKQENLLKKKQRLCQYLPSSYTPKACLLAPNYIFILHCQSWETKAWYITAYFCCNKHFIKMQKNNNVKLIIKLTKEQKINLRNEDHKIDNSNYWKELKEWAIKQ